MGSNSHRPTVAGYGLEPRSLRAPGPALNPLSHSSVGAGPAPAFAALNGPPTLMFQGPTIPEEPGTPSPPTRRTVLE